MYTHNTYVQNIMRGKKRPAAASSGTASASNNNATALSKKRKANSAASRVSPFTGVAISMTISHNCLYIHRC